MSEEPKAEKSLRAKSPRQKFEDMKVLMSKKPKAEKSLRAKSLRQKIFMSEDPRAGKSMSKEPKSKSHA